MLALAVLLLSILAKINLDIIHVCIYLPINQNGMGKDEKGTCNIFESAAYMLPASTIHSLYITGSKCAYSAHFRLHARQLT